MAVSMASKMGRFVDYDDLDPLGWKKYMRFSIKGGSKWIEIKYERLMDFCYACGIFGHSFHNCVHYDDSIPESELPYGFWLRASPTRKRRGGIKEWKRRKSYVKLSREKRSGTGRAKRELIEFREALDDCAL
ncbi:Carnosine N-methyltransferase [Bienertia sinuspersici]